MGKLTEMYGINSSQNFIHNRQRPQAACLTFGFVGCGSVSRGAGHVFKMCWINAVLFYFDRAFPWRGWWLFSAASPGKVGTFSGLDGLPSQGTRCAESRSRDSLCGVNEGTSSWRQDFVPFQWNQMELELLATWASLPYSSAECQTTVVIPDTKHQPLPPESVQACVHWFRWKMGPAAASKKVCRLFQVTRCTWCIWWIKKQLTFDKM